MGERSVLFVEFRTEITQTHTYTLTQIETDRHTHGLAMSKKNAPRGSGGGKQQRQNKCGPEYASNVDGNQLLPVKLPSSLEIYDPPEKNDTSKLKLASKWYVTTNNKHIFDSF